MKRLSIRKYGNQGVSSAEFCIIAGILTIVFLLAATLLKTASESSSNRAVSSIDGNNGMVANSSGILTDEEQY